MHGTFGGHFLESNMLPLLTIVDQNTLRVWDLDSVMGYYFYWILPLIQSAEMYLVTS